MSDGMWPGPDGPSAQDVIDRLRQASKTVAVAESLTGGLVLAAFTDAPGASEVVRGGVVVYATETKAEQLGVDRQLLASRSPIDPDVALEMARGVRRRWSADLGLATTGVAGPDPQDGHPVGEVYVAVADASGDQVRRVDIPQSGTGDLRVLIRYATVCAILALAWEWLGSEPGVR
jgi:nicotinamide-nucleotide amidase